MFDPYHKWLGIPPEHRPPTHYELLHLSASETDLEVIEEAAIRQTTHLRTYQLGPHADLCTKLLNEVAVARKTLLTPALRQKYDAELARTSGATKKVSTVTAAPAGTAAKAAKFDVVEAIDDFDRDDDVRESGPTPKRARGRKSADKPRIRRPASNLPLWIGLGAGAAVLLIVTVIGAAFALRGGEDPKKKQVVVVDQKKNVINPLPIPIPVPVKDGVPDRKLPANNVPPNPARGRTVDLIALFDPADVEKGQGKWNVVNGRLECTDMHFVPRTHFPYKPPAEYDYTVKFSQTKPRNGISLIMPNGPGRSFYLNVARTDGGGVWWTLGTSLDGTTNMGGRLDTFRVGEPCTATIEVRRDGVRCFIDGKFVGEHHDFATMSIDGWRRMKDPSVLSLGCDDPTTFLEVKVTEVGEQGVISRVAKDPVAAPNPRKAGEVNLIALFDKRDVVHGEFRVEKGKLEAPGMHGSPRTHFPYKPPAEYDYTVKFSQPQPRHGISMIMPNGEGGHFFFTVGNVENGPKWILSTGKNDNDWMRGKIDTFKANEVCTAVVQVRKTGVRCLVDGKLAGESKDFANLMVDVWRTMRDPTVLSLGYDDPTTFHEVKVTEIGEAGVITREPVAIPVEKPAAKPVALTKEWGELFDEQGDCKFEEVGGGLRVTVPGTHHGLNVRTGAFNAPRVMKTVDGDFEIQVKVGGTLEPTPKSSVPGAPGFNGAGIVLLIDKTTVVRLERNAWLGINDGRPYSYPLLFEIHRNNGGVENHNVPGRLVNEAVLKNPLHIRLTRTGNKLLAAYSKDGNVWTTRPEVSVPMPARVQVGVSVNSTAVAPVQIEFSELMFGSKEP